jgi:hypothetical protein
LLALAPSPPRDAKLAVKNALKDDASLRLYLHHLPKPEVDAVVRQVREALQTDTCLGRYRARMQRAVGLEYEYRLAAMLQQCNLKALGEEASRVAGYPVTPDFRFVHPLRLRGMEIHWLDSKACFGDSATLLSSLKTQFANYTKALGPGAVIYWFGHLEELPDDGGTLQGSEDPPAVADGLACQAAGLATDRFRQAGVLLLTQFPWEEMRAAASLQALACL